MDASASASSGITRSSSSTPRRTERGFHRRDTTLLLPRSCFARGTPAGCTRGGEGDGVISFAFVRCCSFSRKDARSDRRGGASHPRSETRDLDSVRKDARNRERIDVRGGVRRRGVTRPRRRRLEANIFNDTSSLLEPGIADSARNVVIASTQLEDGGNRWGRGSNEGWRGETNTPAILPNRDFTVREVSNRRMCPHPPDRRAPTLPVVRARGARRGTSSSRDRARPLAARA